MSTLLYNLLAECGADQTPGTEVIIYHLCVCDVLDPFPQPPTTGAQGATMIITDDILLKPLKAWKKMKVIINSGELKDERKGSGSFDQSLDFETVTDENYDEWFNQNSGPGGCLLTLIPTKDGKKRLIGHPTKGPAQVLNAVRTSGKTTEDNAKWTATIQASPGNVMYYYEGEIDLDETT